MEKVHEELQRKLDEAFVEIRKDRLPGWEAVFYEPKVLKWMLERENAVFQAVNDEAEIRFAESLERYKAGWFRINRNVAEKYRKENPDPTTWELRYLRYMKVAFIRCESAAGEFYITPRPRRPKPGVRAISVEELEALLSNDVTKKAFELFGGLPMDESEFKQPPEGENHLHFYAGAEQPFKTVFNEEIFRGRKSFRRRPFPDPPKGF